MPLAQYVEETVLDDITDGRHRLLREVSNRLHGSTRNIDPSTSDHIDFSLKDLPRAARDLVELRKVLAQQLDMAALLRKPEELFLVDHDWAGKRFADEHKKKLLEERKRLEAEKEKALEDGSAHPMQYLAFAIQSHEEAQSIEGPQGDTPAMLQYALDHSAGLILEMAQAVHNRVEAQSDVEMADATGQDQESEDPSSKKLRLELLALAKRAPLDKISALPADLVPEPIRHIVPTLSKT